MLEKGCNTLDCDLDRKKTRLIWPITLVVPVRAIISIDENTTQLFRIMYIFELCLKEHNIDEYYYNINNT